MRVSQKAQETRVKQTQLECDILDLDAKYELTDVEFLQVLSSVMQGRLKNMLRDEWLADYETPAMEEKDDEE